jgi:hypothetical protein
VARMRTIKPEACTSESLALVDRAVRWTFAALWTHCDDEGRAVWNLRLIKAAIYPLDDTMTAAAIEDDMNELTRVGALCRYEVAGKSYVHVPSWSDHQHPNRKVESKLPPCPKTDHSPSADLHLTEDAVSTHGAVTSVVVVGGVGGDGGVEGAGRNAGTLAVIETPTAQTIVAEWIDRSKKRPPERVIGQVSKEIRQMLAEGIDPDDVRRGLAAWMTKDLHPSTLPSIVNGVMNAPTPVGRGQREVDDLFERSARRQGVIA